MNLTALLLSRLQFAFTISFHIIFPSFTIGLAMWLTVLEALYLATGRPAYRVVFEFWLKIFGVAFGLGVVSGIVMAFQFGTNWSEMARMSGPIQGVLLSYETFTAFFLEASFFGILLFGRSRVAPWFYLVSTAMVALGTTFSAFLIPIQLFFGHLVGDYVHDYQPVKFAALEGRWHDEQPAGEVLLALPDPAAETNRYEIKIPILGSLIGSMSFTSKEVGLTDFPPQDRPPVLIPFFTFRIMVGCGLAMLALAWIGSYMNIKGGLERSRLLLWLTFFSFPLPFI